MLSPNAQTIFAIPTLYAGIRFRSRLEAKWAAFFDFLDWPWTYEPDDLNGYIPDFVLHFYKPLLIEVKPAYSIAELYGYVHPIEQSKWQHEALVVGVKPFPSDDNVHVIGILGERPSG